MKKDWCAVALFMREINHIISFVSNVMCVLFVSYVPNVLHRSLLLFVFDVM